MKRFSGVIMLMLLIIALGGCANSVRQVSVEDPQVMAEDQARFQELEEHFSAEYPNGPASEMQKDPLYEEWRRLDPLGYTARQSDDSVRGRVFATVDLANQTYTYDGKTYPYEGSGSDITVDESFEGIDQATIPNLIREAERVQQADQDHNNRVLLRSLWMPIIFTAIGILSIVRPDIIWFWEHGHRYKDAEQSDMSIGINIFRGILAIGLAVVLLFFIYNALVL